MTTFRSSSEAMRIWLSKVSKNGKSGLIGTDDESRALIDSLADGECREFEPASARSLLDHHRYWAICTEAAKHITRIEIDCEDGKPVFYPVRDKEDVHTALKFCTGLYTKLPIEGTSFSIRVPKSTNFRTMKREAWEQHWPKVLEALTEKVAPHILDDEARGHFMQCIEHWTLETQPAAEARVA